MITLLASIAGFIGSIIPEVFRLFVDRSDKKHELELLDRQINMQQKGVSSRLDEISCYAEMAENKSLYSTFKSGIFWADALNASVRPMLAYSFFGLYAYIKYLQFQMLEQIEDHRTIIEILWSVDDQAIFAGIISFYFGQRSLSRMLNNKGRR